MNHRLMINGAIQMYGAATALIFSVGYFFRERAHNQRTRCFTMVLSSDLLMMLAGSLGHFLPEDAVGLRLIMKAVSILGVYSVLGFYTFYTWLVISEKRKLSAVIILITTILCIAGVVSWCVSSYKKMVLAEYGREVGFYAGSGFPEQMFAAAVLLINLLLILTNLKILGKINALLLAFVLIFPAVVQCIPILPDLELGYPMITLSVLLCYLSRQIQDEQKWIEQETTLAETRMFILKSQMRPHFLHNVLTTIYYLCDKDPQRASDALRYLSDYLETNLRDINRYGKVAFTEELRLVESYLYLEKLRFGNRLSVEMDIKARDFLLPSMTLQPIVENSVKHGVSKKVDGGTVRISTSRETGFWLIVVEDDGIGFSEKPTGDRKDKGNRVQLGLRNVDERLRILSGGSLSVESAAGKGTKVSLRIPAL